MTKNKFLRFVVTALMLSVMLTLTAIAAIEGGMGTIKGADETYKAAPAVINAKGDGLSVDTAKAIVLSEANNTGLAGIYAVSNDDFATKTYVYVYGDFAERKLVPNKIADGRPAFTSGTAFVAGTMSGPNSAIMGTNYKVGPGADGTSWFGSVWSQYYISSLSSHVGRALVEAIEKAADSVAKGEALEAIEKQYKTGVYWRYAYDSSEIIPVSEFSGIKYKVFNRQGRRFCLPQDTLGEFRLYVADSNGAVSTYSVKKNANVSSLTNWGKSVEIFSTDFVNLPTEGWIVGFEIIPFADFDVNKATINTAEANNNICYALCIDYDKGMYIISAPKTPKPTGLSVDENGKVTGLEAGFSYEYVNLNNTTRLTEFAQAGITTTDLVYSKLNESTILTAGVWAIRVAETSETPASEPCVIYVRGSSTGNILHYDENTGAIVSQNRYQGKGWRVTSGYRDSRFFTPGSWDGVLGYDGKYGSAMALFDTGDHNLVNWAAQYYFKGPEGDKTYGLTYEQFVHAVESEHATYQYLDEEITSFDNFISFTYKTDCYRTKIHAEGDVYTKLIFYVINESGELEKREWIDKMAFNSLDPTTHTVKKADFEDTTGYIIAMEIHPTGYVPETTVLSPIDNGNGHNTAYNIVLIPDGYKAKEMLDAPEIGSYPIVAGGHGRIFGLNANVYYQVRWSTDDGATFNEWSDVPSGSTSFKVTEPGVYHVRVKGSDLYFPSKIATVNVLQADAIDTFNSQMNKVYLTEDFVEVKADYEIDVTVKNWISALSLQNLKEITPESTVIIVGDGFKYQLTAGNISVDDKVHYYNFDISFNGESRSDRDYKRFVEASGDLYVKNVYFESSNGLPFKNAELSIYVGNDYDGMELDSASYNERIDRLRYLEIVQVTNGWVTLTEFGEPIVLLIYED